MVVNQKDDQLYRDRGKHRRPETLRADEAILNCCLFFSSARSVDRPRRVVLCTGDRMMRNSARRAAGQTAAAAADARSGIQVVAVPCDERSARSSEGEEFERLMAELSAGAPPLGSVRGGGGRGTTPSRNVRLARTPCPRRNGRGRATPTPRHRRSAVGRTPEPRAFGTTKSGMRCLMRNFPNAAALGRVEMTAVDEGSDYESCLAACQIKRRQLATWIAERRSDAFLRDVVVGAFVRLLLGTDPETGRRTYRVCRVAGFGRARAPYSVTPSHKGATPHKARGARERSGVQTDRLLVLQFGRSTREWEIDKISNQGMSVEEGRFWVDKSAEAGKEFCVGKAELLARSRKIRAAA
jgi:hypothetical protein